MPNTETIIDIMYDGWVKYRKEVKGYTTTPIQMDIEDWEMWRELVFERVRQHAREANNTRPPKCESCG